LGIEKILSQDRFKAPSKTPKKLPRPRFHVDSHELVSVNYFCASHCLTDLVTRSVSLPHKNVTQRMDGGFSSTQLADSGKHEPQPPRGGESWPGDRASPPAVDRSGRRLDDDNSRVTSS